jgi:hypothetical protein
MTRADFNHLLSTIKALSPEQLRELRQQLDQMLEPPASPKRSTARPPGKGAKRARAAAPKLKPLTSDEFNRRSRATGRLASLSDPDQAQGKPPSLDALHRKMMARGLIRRLPDPSLDIDDDDPDDQPVPIKGEPLSETIIRERR